MQSQVTLKTVWPMSMSESPCCFILVSFNKKKLVADIADESFAAVRIFSTLLSTVLKQARQMCRAECTVQISCQIHLLTTVFSLYPQITNYSHEHEIKLGRKVVFLVNLFLWSLESEDIVFPSYKGCFYQNPLSLVSFNWFFCSNLTVVE